jgi:ketosteroid isomerase-like protein
MVRWLAAFALVACGSDPKPVTRPGRPASELSPALEPLAWWLGDWQGERGTEHWVAAGGALFGIGLANDGTFEVMIIDDAPGMGPADGVRRFIAMPNGGDSTEFREREIAGESATFANDAHDFPKTIAYRKAAPGLVATVAGGDKSIEYTFQPAAAARAPALEDADRAFSADNGKRGIAAWVTAFDAEGGMLRNTERIQGHAAITEEMTNLIASGTLAWAPIASGVSGKVGFTVGKATYTGAKPGNTWRSGYVTIWRQQADGSWKVWFDVARIVNE